MSNHYREQIEKILQRVVKVLGPIVLNEYKTAYPIQYRAKISLIAKTAGFPVSSTSSDEELMTELDSQKLLKLVITNDDPTYRTTSSFKTRDLSFIFISELALWRNLWAHEKPLDEDDFYRVADTFYRLMLEMKEKQAAREIEHLIEEMRKKRNNSRGKTIIVEIDESTFNATSVEKIYELVLVYLVQRKYIQRVDIPVSTSDKRYLLATSPVHPYGNPFLMPIEHKGYHLEAHNNRPQAMANLEKLVQMCGRKLTIVQS